MATLHSYPLEKLVIIFLNSVHYNNTEYFNHSHCLESPIYMQWNFLRVSDSSASPELLVRCVANKCVALRWWMQITFTDFCGILELISEFHSAESWVADIVTHMRKNFPCLIEMKQALAFQILLLTWCTDRFNS
jgi:hypothetical protein